jgi:HEAT repeat protein
MARRADEKSPGAGAKMLEPLVPLLEDDDPEVRAQAARVLGEQRVDAAFDGLIKSLRSPEERVSMFAAEALGKLGRREALPQLLLMIREAGDHDPYLRHAYVDALLGLHDDTAMAQAARHDSAAVRMVALLAMRQLKSAEIARFLGDEDPLLVREAARAIDDENIIAAVPTLSGLIATPVPDQAVMCRVLNANLRNGQMLNAAALASYAAIDDFPEILRIDALKLLALWAHPPAHDYVSGAAQSPAKLDATHARFAFKQALPQLQAVKSPEFAAAVAATKKALEEGAK